MAELEEKRAELLQLKLQKAREMVINLNPNDPDYTEKVKQVTAFLSSINDDIKVKDTLELEKTRQKDEKKTNFIKHILQGLSIVVPAGIAVLCEFGKNHRFDRATEKENAGEPILSLTDKTVVQDGLRERESKPTIGFKLY